MNVRTGRLSRGKKERKKKSKKTKCLLFQTDGGIRRAGAHSCFCSVIKRRRGRRRRSDGGVYRAGGRRNTEVVSSQSRVRVFCYYYYCRRFVVYGRAKRRSRHGDEWSFSAFVAFVVQSRCAVIGLSVVFAHYRYNAIIIFSFRRRRSP